MVATTNNGKLTATARSDLFQILLQDEDGQNILSIDDGSLRQSLAIEIINTSGRKIELQSIDDRLSSNNYHFCISFRPGTLLLDRDEDRKITLKEKEAGWQIIQQDNTFYLLSNSSETRTIESGKSITLTLENIGAAPEGGARGTRVEIKYNNLQYSGSSESISGNKLQYLNIVNQRGKKQVPLYAGFIGSNTILNDGTENELTLTIQSLPHYNSSLTVLDSEKKNIEITKSESNSYGSLTLKGVNEAGVLDNAAKFTISFDVAIADNDAKDWALVNKTNADDIEISIENGQEHWHSHGIEKQGITPKWNFICKERCSILKKDRQEIFRLKISKIKTQLLSGYANLYIYYENIPGYWDGYITVPIHKGPLVYRESGNDIACVGIGTDKPQAKLHVKSTAKVDGLKVEGNTAIAGNLSVSGKIDKLDVADHFEATVRAADFKFGHSGRRGEPGRALVDYTDKLHINFAKDWSKGVVMEGNTEIAGKLSISDTASLKGKVGIGIAPGTEQLKVKGNTEIAGKLSISDTASLKGKVGIGIAPGTEQLKVKGDTKISGQLSVSNSLKIGNTVINEDDLKILNKLSSGSLEVDLYNTAHGEYLYASSFKPFDNDRRRVFTWRKKSRVTQGFWRLHFPR